MRSIGFDANEILWVWTFLSAVLQLGNLEFGRPGEEARITNKPSPVGNIAGMMHIESKTLSSALTTRRIKAGSEWVTSPVTSDVALNVRDGLAKCIYQKVRERAEPQP